jgi:hypothetical protein
MRFLCLGASIWLVSCTSVPPPPAERAADAPVEGAVKPDAKAQAMLAGGSAALAAADLDRAERTARALIARDPRLAQAWTLLGQALTERAHGLKAVARSVTQLEDTEAALLRATRLAPKSAHAHAALGRFYEVDGHREAGLAAHRRALSLSAFLPESLLAAARLSMELGEERGARLHLEALRALPDLPTEALIQEARCYLSLADAPDQSAERATSLARALRAFHELSIREPEDPRGPAGEAHCRFTLALERATVPDAEKNRIRELWQEAARLAPADPTPRFNLALFLESKLVGDRAAAIATYRATLARDATHLPSLVNLARLLWVDGDHDAAKALYRRALPKLEDERERREVRRLLKQ